MNTKKGGSTKKSVIKVGIFDPAQLPPSQSFRTPKNVFKTFSSVWIFRTFFMSSGFVWGIGGNNFINQRYKPPHPPYSWGVCLFHHVGGQHQIHILFWPILKKNNLGLQKNNPVCRKILHLAGVLFEDTPYENLNISCGLSEVCNSQLMDIWYICLLFRALFLRQGNCVKTLHVSGADGGYQCFYNVFSRTKTHHGGNLSWWEYAGRPLTCSYKRRRKKCLLACKKLWLIN